ncbi:hypothetical protein DPMN_128083 [Dreissena polymorpha]|uniref:Uncharacterized protein n=1 Tax=Dreissena polymorpha TaxID=45954 RepID=A0A9D4H6H2_DREPO|nr:hypothetical protein DPMN_128083 [Dreissena polymorpha]
MSTRSKSSNTLRKSKRKNSLESAISSQVFTKIANVNGTIVAVKQINKPYTAVTASLVREINEVWLRVTARFGHFVCLA